jgi:cobalt-zinc-cadmium efflux system protein
VPEELELDAMTASILALDGVDSLHDLHVWSQDGSTHVMTLHVVVNQCVTTELATLKEAVRQVGLAHGIDHTTVEIETTTEPDCGYQNEKS